MRSKQIQNEMVDTSAMTLNNSEHKSLKILTPKMVRDYGGQFRPFKPRTPSTQTTTEIHNLVGLNRTTLSSTTGTSPVSVSLAPKEITTKTVTRHNPHFTTGGYSSEESATVTEIPIQNRTDENDTNPGPDLEKKDEELVPAPRDDIDSFSPANSVHNNETALAFDSNQVNLQMDLMMFPSARADVRKRKIERLRFCAGFRTNFGNANVGLRCCMRTLNCFDNLPQYLDETLFHRGRHHFSPAERLHLCQDIDDSMHCIERELDRRSCKSVTSLMNRKMQPQMGKVKQFYQSICPKDPNISTVPRNGKPTTPTNHNNLKSRGFGPIPGSLLPFVGGAIAGLIILSIVMIIAIYCRKQCKIKKRNSNSQETSFESDQSLRYKSVSHNRRRSSVYEEIDEDKMVPSINSPKKKKEHGVDESRISRKLPSAPSEEKFKTGNHYYLSPTSSLPEDNRINDNDKAVTNFGYLDLQTDENGQSYAKLKTEGEYITPEEIASTPKQREKNPKEEYHMYFVLEKEDE
ncbi:uncharacterized protein LOC127719050 [Mytilus californianus]|uniref:uncharacterized protein LOC127719050 n=1 Tax=Mytilus californianus TaxID=6549 RepID=UPI002246DF11|nr:uncharacterized protein LOC127719050 [Mytilus californianus]